MLEEDEELPAHGEEEQENEAKRGICGYSCSPITWLEMLCTEMHWTLVFGVVVVNGISQGLGGALTRIGTEYYMKDVQKVQPSESQVYDGIQSIPWIVKPLWGLFTDVLPIFGYRRRPYLIFAGVLGVISMLFLSLHKNLHLVLALVSLTAGNAGVAIADVVVDACVTKNSISYPSLAADMQSLCTLSESIGALLGFSLGGIFVHLIGPMGLYGLLVIPGALVFLVGIVLKEPYTPNFVYGQVNRKFLDAAKAMWNTLICPSVWRPCLYMYVSIALSLDISEGMFYWSTDAKDGPTFSKEAIGYIMSIGSLGSVLGATLYQCGLKNHPFRDLLFWSQLLNGLSGMLDLVLVLRFNLKFKIPDYFFAVMDASVSQMIARLKWMPLLVLSSKLCPPGIEGTFFALVMSIENFGVMSSSWGGGLLLHMLNVTRTQFDHFWLAILIRNIFRVSPLCLLFLVPRGDPNSAILPAEVLNPKEDDQTPENDNIELVSLVTNVESHQPCHITDI